MIEPPKGVDEGDLDRLYRGPLEEFTAARNELAKSAPAAKGLKKPSRAAWLVNQLAVRKADAVAELLEAGKELRAAQEEMLAGSADREKLRDAAASEQRLVDSLTRSAEALGAEHGVGSPILTRVTETLQAASSDPEVAEAIRRGWLEREQRAASIGLVGPAEPAPRSPTKGGKARATAERKKREQEARHRKRAEQRIAKAEAHLERERKALEAAEEKVEQARRKVREAELDLRDAQRELDAI